MWHVAVNVTNRWGIHTRGTGRWQAQQAHCGIWSEHGAGSLTQTACTSC